MNNTGKHILRKNQIQSNRVKEYFASQTKMTNTEPTYQDKKKEMKDAKVDVSDLEKELDIVQKERENA